MADVENNDCRGCYEIVLPETLRGRDLVLKDVYLGPSPNLKKLDEQRRRCWEHAARYVLD